MSKKAILVVLCSLLLIISFVSASAFVSTASAQSLITGKPNLDVNIPEPLLVPGETTELTIQILNDGEVSSGAPDSRSSVTTARNVLVELDTEDTPITVHSGDQALGDVTDSTPGTATFEITIPEDAKSGDYDLDVTLDYSYTSLISENSGVIQDVSRTRTRDASITIDDTPRFSLQNGTTQTQIGDSGTLSLDVQNIGGEAARDVSVTLESNSQKVSFGTANSDSSYAGTLQPDDTTSIQVDIDIHDDASLRNYTLDGTVEYTNTNGVTKQESGLSLTFKPTAKQTFSLTNLSAALQVGEDGVISGTIVNTGPIAARNVAVQLDTASPNINAIESKVAVGTLSPGESNQFSLPVQIADSAEAVSRPLELSVTYQDSENDGRTVQDIEQPTIHIEPEQTFKLTNVESTLRIGEDGNIHGTLVNTGMNSASNTELVISSSSTNIIPLENSIAIGDLHPNETEDFRFPIEISGEAESVPKIIDLTIQYRDDDNDLREYSDLATLIQIGERRDEFLLTITSPPIPAGDSTLLDVRITNNLNETITDIEPRMFTDSPLDSSDDEGFIQSLDPGESTTVTFDMSTSSSALAKTYPAQVDFRYVDDQGNSKISKTYRLAIEVTEPAEEGFPWVTAIALLVLLASALGVFYWRHQS